jgi:hypothetical protein
MKSRKHSKVQPLGKILMLFRMVYSNKLVEIQAVIDPIYDSRWFDFAIYVFFLFPHIQNHAN